MVKAVLYKPFRDARGRFAANPYQAALKIAKSYARGKVPPDVAKNLIKARREFQKSQTPYAKALREVKEATKKRRKAAYRAIAKRESKSAEVQKKFKKAEAYKTKSARRRGVTLAKRYKHATANERRLTTAVETLLSKMKSNGEDMFTREQAIEAVADFAARHREWIEGGSIGAEPVFEYPTNI